MSLSAREEDSVAYLRYALTVSLADAFSIDERLAVALAEPLLAAMRRNHACDKIYVPAPDTSLRDEAIRREYNGNNRDELCRRYNLSRSGFYKAVSRR